LVHKGKVKQIALLFVWVDETGSDARDMLRKYGYATRSQS
jgi:hypothetical protein